MKVTLASGRGLRPMGEYPCSATYDLSIKGPTAGSRGWGEPRVLHVGHDSTSLYAKAAWMQALDRDQSVLPKGRCQAWSVFRLSECTSLFANRESRIRKDESP